MKWEVYIRLKSDADKTQNARKKVAYVTAMTAAKAKQLALARYENAAFTIDGTPRIAS